MKDQILPEMKENIITSTVKLYWLLHYNFKICSLSKKHKLRVLLKTSIHGLHSTSTNSNVLSLLKNSIKKFYKSQIFSCYSYRHLQEYMQVDNLSHVQNGILGLKII